VSERPITSKVKRLRQRQRKDGTWAIWWEPEPAVKALGFDRVDLDPNRPTWSKREAIRLNQNVHDVRSGISPSAHRGYTIDDLIANYRQRELLKKAPKTQASYNGLLNLISKKWGSVLVSAFTKPILFVWYEALYDKRGPRQAEALIRMMSVLFSRAERIGWRYDNSNPCFRLKMETPKRRTRCANWEEIDALCATALSIGSRSMATAIKLAVFQGQRPTNIHTAKLDEFNQTTLPIDGGGQETVWIWSLLRTKRNTKGVMRLHPEVSPLVAGLIASAKEGEARLLIDEVTDAPYSDDLFSKRFAQVRKIAAVEMPSVSTLKFRDFRRTFAMFAREADIHKDDVADVLGNSAATDWQLGETYMPTQFATASRAVMSIKRPAKPNRKKA